jgi:hypothetical protein
VQASTGNRREINRASLFPLTEATRTISPVERALGGCTAAGAASRCAAVLLRVSQKEG